MFIDVTDLNADCLFYGCFFRFRINDTFTHFTSLCGMWRGGGEGGHWVKLVKRSVVLCFLLQTQPKTFKLHLPAISSDIKKQSINCIMKSSNAATFRNIRVGTIDLIIQYILGLWLAH